MKKSLFFVASALLVLSSCSNNDELSEVNPSNNEIRLSVSTEGTRASAVTGTDASAIQTVNGGFVLYGFDGSEAIINAKDYTYASDKWSTDEVYYWTGNEMKFFAYSPKASGANGVTSSISAGASTQKVSYAAPTTVSDQVDLLYASATTTSGTVTLPFNHALAQVTFQAKLKSAKDKFTVNINSITIHNLKNKGEIDLATATPAMTVADDAVATDYKFETSTTALTTTAASLTKADNQVLMLVPQTVATTWSTGAFSSDSYVYLEIECKVQSTVNNHYFIGGESGYGKLYMPFKTAATDGSMLTLVAGKNNVFTLIFGNDGSEYGFGYDADGNRQFSGISVTATLADWETNARDITL